MSWQGRTAPVRMERRQTPRMAVRGIAYVNLAPDNGGTVLNVSEGGLCFQSRAPIRRVDTIRFWFSYRRKRIEARGEQTWRNEPSRGGVSRFIEVYSELVWIDDTRKMGGLRFKNLPEVDRQQIRDWMHEPAVVGANDRPAPQFSALNRSYKSLARGRLAKLEELFRQIRAARLWRGYSGGLVSGILLSAVLAGLFTFLIHSHKLGDSIVQLGELLGGRPLSPIPAKSQEGPLTTPRPQPLSLEGEQVSAEPLTVPTPIPDLPSEKLPSTASPTVAKFGQPRLEAKVHQTPSLSRGVARPSVPRIVLNLPGEADESMRLVPAPEIPLTSQLGVHTEPSKVGDTIMTPEKYLEVGKFKERPLADALVDRVSQLDFPAKVSASSRFFKKSYQVLVGPYESDSEAEAVHKDLSSHGFTPRSYERGRRNFMLRPRLKVGATHLPVGDSVISWESYTPDAIVKIEASGESAILEGKWVKQGKKYEEDAIAYVKERDGSLALLEIRFSGLKEALVFGGGTNH